MHVYDLQDKLDFVHHVFFKDEKYFYVVDAEIASKFKFYSSIQRLESSNIVIDLATGKVRKSRYFAPGGTNAQS